MTPDLNTIRAALAATPPKKAKYHIEKNAPTWLAALCTEVERLRELSAQLQVEQDVALAKYEVLREQYVNDTDMTTIKLRAERDAALAENERLTRERREAYLTLMTRESEYAGLYPFDEMTASREAWRACADQLAAQVKGPHTCHHNKCGVCEALAVYERLRAGPGDGPAVP